MDYAPLTVEGTDVANDAERLGFAIAQAKGEAVIRAMGGDPKKPTRKQAMAAAKAMLAPLQGHRMNDGEVLTLVAEAMELAETIRRETH